MVKVTLERIPDSQVRLEIEVEPERIQQSVEKAYRKLVNRMDIPGFRRGKAPRHIVERLVGKEALFKEGLEDLVGDVYAQALKDLDLHPIAQPEVDLEPKVADLKPGESLTVKATVAVEPTIELGDYRAIRVQPLSVQVTEQEVNQLVEQIREQHAEWVPVERPVAEGDRIILDILGEVGTYTQLYSASGEPLVQSEGGKPIVEETSTEFDVDKASSRYPRGVVDQLIGMTAGKEKQFELSLPPDYPDAELANKLALFKARIGDVKEKRVPDYDDELAKAIGYESREEMRAGLRERSQARAERQAEEIYEETVVREAVARATFEVPPALVNHEIDHNLEHIRQNLQNQGVALADYLRITGKSEPELREELRERAVQNVRATLVLGRISEIESIIALPEDVEREIDLVASMSGPQAQRVRQSLAAQDQRDSLARRIARRKTVEFLVELARSALETVMLTQAETESNGEVAAPDVVVETVEAELVPTDVALSTSEEAMAPVPPLVEATLSSATGGDSSPANETKVAD